MKRADDEALRWLFLLYLSVTVEHVEQLLVLQHDGSFHQVLKVRVDSRSDSGILSHPLLRQDVDVVPHLDGQTGKTERETGVQRKSFRIRSSTICHFFLLKISNLSIFSCLLLFCLLHYKLTIISSVL